MTVPLADVDYAVENALWVASTVVTGPMSGPTAGFTSIFCDQLETHWRALRTLHAADASRPPLTRQATLGGWR